MKRLIILFCIILFSIKLLAPSNGVAYLLVSEPIQPFKKLIYAIGMVESSCDTLAYNPNENAVGYFQIRQIRINDFNKRTGKRYKLTDMYNYDKALEVFLYYAVLDYETCSRAWNGSGEKTNKYWQKVNTIMH